MVELLGLTRPKRKQKQPKQRKAKREGGNGTSETVQSERYLPILIYVYHHISPFLSSLLMDSVGEWRRQRALAAFRAESESSTPTAKPNWHRLHRFMPPPTTYDTPIETQNQTLDDDSFKTRGSGGDASSFSSFLNEDSSSDPFGLQGTTHGIEGHRPHTTDEQLEADDNDVDIEENEDGQENDTHQSHGYPSTGDPSHSSMVFAPSTWMPGRSSRPNPPPAAVHFAGESTFASAMPSSHPSLLDQSRVDSVMDESAQSSSSSTSSSPALPSRKRSRLSASSETPDAVDDNGNVDSSHQTPSSPSHRSRKKFNKSHHPSANRELVQTAIVSHNVPKDATHDEAEQAYMFQPTTTEVTTSHSLGESTAPASSSSSSSSISPSLPPNTHSASSSSNLRWTNGSSPLTGLTPSSTAATMPSPRRTRKPSSSSSSPSRHSPQRHAPSTYAAIVAAATAASAAAATPTPSFRHQPQPPPAPILNPPKSLSQTGALWIQDFSRPIIPQMTEEEIRQRIALLQQQPSTSGNQPNTHTMTLTPVFFSMGLSLLIRQRPLKLDFVEPLVSLIECAVDQRWIPTGLKLRLIDHMRDFAGRLHGPSRARVTDAATTLMRQSGNEPKPIVTIAPSSVSAGGGDGGVRPGLSNSNRLPRSYSNTDGDFQMVTHARASRQAECPSCGLNIIGTSSTFQAHLRICRSQSHQQEAAVRFNLNGMPQVYEQAWPPPSSNRRYPSLGASFVPASNSASSHSAPVKSFTSTPDHMKTNRGPSGSSASDAIAIDDSDEADEFPTVATISLHQRLTLDDSLAFLRSSFAADEFVHSQKLPLVDPLTLTRIEVPVRSKQCSHVRCMDLGVFLQHARDASQRKAKLKCTICSIETKIADLVVDSFIEMRLKEGHQHQKAASEVIIFLHSFN